MLHKGKITSWNDDKAFGNRSHRPNVNDVVTYSVTKDSKGRTQAVNATRPGEKQTIRSSKRPGSFPIFFAFLFLAIVGASTFMTGLPLIVPAAYLILSSIAYFTYAWDKASAQTGRWRTSEGTLHLLALAGGWPGALLAQQTLRHKSKKRSFRAVLWITVLLNCAAFAWLHTTEGRSYLQQLMELVT